VPKLICFLSDEKIPSNGREGRLLDSELIEHLCLVVGKIDDLLPIASSQDLKGWAWEIVTRQIECSAMFSLDDRRLPSNGFLLLLGASVSLRRFGTGQIDAKGGRNTLI
jgi:hypothetical protein